MPPTVASNRRELALIIASMFAEREEQKTMLFTGTQEEFRSDTLFANIEYHTADVHHTAIEKYNYTRSQTGTRREITIEVTYRETAAQQKAVRQRVREVVDSHIKQHRTAHERLLAMHDWLIANLEYDHSYSAYTAYAGMFLGKTVCAGYSQAVAYFCEELSIPVRIVHGEAIRTGNLHAWNLVAIDGIWYHLDVTWNDPNSDVHSTHAPYNYYLLTDTEIARDHRIHERTDAPPYPTANNRYADVLTKATNSWFGASESLKKLPYRLGLNYIQPQHTLVGQKGLESHLENLFQLQSSTSTMRYVPSAAGVRVDFDRAWAAVTPRFPRARVKGSYTTTPYLRAGGAHDVLIEFSFEWT